MSPPGQVTTRDGHLSIVVEYEETHGLQFKSGMIQSWNKFCFTTGYVEGSFPRPQMAVAIAHFAQLQSVLCSLVKKTCQAT